MENPIVGVVVRTTASLAGDQGSIHRRVISKMHVVAWIPLQLSDGFRSNIPVLLVLHPVNAMNLFNDV